MTKNIPLNPWFMWPALAFFITGIALLLVFPYGNEILLLNAWRTEPYNSIFRWTTRLGEAHVFFLLGIAALFWRFRFALLIALTGLLILPVSYLAKDKIGVDRPVTYFEKTGVREAVVLVPGEHPNGGQTSFPSGHTMAAFGLFGLLAFATAGGKSWAGLVCAVFAIAVAISRVFLVQHFLVDVIGGGIMGLAIGSVVWWIDRRYLIRWQALDRSLLSSVKGA